MTFNTVSTPLEFTADCDQSSSASGQQIAILRTVLSMQAWLSEELSVTYLAEQAFFSKFHFTRIFSAHTGLPPGRFLAELRTLTAEDLLVNSQLSFTEITYRVGYTSVGTFSSRFKQVTGVSPTAYRLAMTPASSPLRGAQPRRGDTRLVLHALERAANLHLSAYPTPDAAKSRVVA